MFTREGGEHCTNFLDWGNNLGGNNRLGGADTTHTLLLEGNNWGGTLRNIERRSNLGAGWVDGLVKSDFIIQSGSHQSTA